MQDLIYCFLYYKHKLAHQNWKINLMLATAAPLMQHALENGTSFNRAEFLISKAVTFRERQDT
jgi:hypothetical protein